MEVLPSTRLPLGNLSAQNNNSKPKVQKVPEYLQNVTVKYGCLYHETINYGLYQADFMFPVVVAFIVGKNHLILKCLSP